MPQESCSRHEHNHKTIRLQADNILAYRSSIALFVSCPDYSCGFSRILPPLKATRLTVPACIVVGPNIEVNARNMKPSDGTQRIITSHHLPMPYLPTVTVLYTTDRTADILKISLIVFILRFRCRSTIH